MSDNTVMPEKSGTFQQEQSKAVRLVVLLAVTLAAINILVAWSIGTDLLFVAGGAGLFTAIGLLAFRTSVKHSTLLAIQSLTGQAIILNATLIGHPLQIDSHMVYFAVLAICTIMSDWRALLLSAATIAVHHVTLTVFLPVLVYPTTDLFFNAVRTSMHAGIVVVETLALFWAINSRLKLTALASARTLQAETATGRAKDALTQAEKDNATAVEAKERADAALMKAADAQGASERAHSEAQKTSDARMEEQETNREASEKREAELTSLLDAFRAALDQMASGDLSARIEEELAEEYEDLRKNFNFATEKLEVAFRAVSEETDSIQSQSEEIAGSATDLAKRTEHQANTLASIAGSLDQLTTTINAVADDTDGAQKLTESTSLEAQQGREIMSKAVRAMDDIKTSSSKIQKITAVIEDIAFQTNLLALNAGVEAARAGDAGRGFAVVASEVRALAQNSSNAAHEINTLISGSVTEIDEGAELVNKTGDALSSIYTAVQEIKTVVGSISQTTREQSNRLGEANQSISALETVTQQNAAMFEETTAANSILASSSQRLGALVEQFKHQNTVEVEDLKQAS